MMDKNKLTAKIHKLSNEKNVSFNVLLQVFFFERFLARLSKSEYNCMFILKGGFLLSSILGITERSTTDLDFSVANIPFSQEHIVTAIRNIIKIELDDDIIYEFRNVRKIMEKTTYGGYQISLIGKLENIQVSFSIDLATGDPIIPEEVTYTYHPIVIEDDIILKSYTVESVVAEKLQTILNKQQGNSRMKDFYDIYILMSLHDDFINRDILKKAILNTFEYRRTKISKGEFTEVINLLVEDQEFLARWNTFVKKNYYVEDVDFYRVKDQILDLINNID